MDDFIRTVKAHLYERIASPLAAIFTTSWVLWNYKFVLVLLSGTLSVTDKLSYISETLYSSGYVYFFQGFFLPATTTILFIYIYPWFAKKVYEKKRHDEKELYIIKQSIEDKKCLTVEDSLRIKRESLNLEAEYNIELSRFKSEIDKNKQVIEQLSKRNNKLSNNYETLKNEVKMKEESDSSFKVSQATVESIKETLLDAQANTELESFNALSDFKGKDIDVADKILSILADTTLHKPHELKGNVVASMKITPAKFELLINKLMEINLVQTIKVGQRPLYKLTNKGTEYVVDELNL